MSKRTKATVDYFPHIIKKGKTIFILESKFGNDGYAFWFKLLELLGDNEGHYIDCNDPSTWEYLLAYIRVNEETVDKIIEVLIELGNIDKELWEHKIIFCQNFIDNIGDVYKRRIIEKPTKEAICQQLGIVLTVKCIQLPTSNGINVDICPQSKVKESKVKERREYAPSILMTEEEYQKLINEIGDPLTKEYIKDLSLYIQSKGKRYKSHYATVLAWYRRDEKQGKVKRPQDDESQPKYIPKTKLTPEQIKKNKVKITEALEKLKNKFDIPIKAKGG